MSQPISEVINLDFTPGKPLQVCHSSQFDEGRLIKINLFNDGQPYTCQSGDSFELNVRKPDSTVITRTIVPTGEPATHEGKTYVYITTTQQMVAVAGENICEVKMTNDGNTIGSANFIMQVEQSPLDGGVQSASAIHDLETQVENIVENNLEIGDLSDVHLTNVWPDKNGQVLTWSRSAGGWTNASPGAMTVDHLTDIGDVTQVGSTIPNGSVLQYDDQLGWFNGGQLKYYIYQMNDVSIDDETVTDGHILVYDDSGVGEWKNAAISYDILPDCYPTWSITPSDDLNRVWVWKYDPLSQKTGWTNDFITFDSISSIVVDSNTIGTDSVLFYDGGTGKWENHYIQLGGLNRSSNISDIQVDTSHISTGQVLSYNATTDKWVSKNLESTDIRYIELDGTLTAGSTSITLSDQTLPNSPISTISTKTLDFYTDIYGVNPTSVSVTDKDPTVPLSSNTVTLTFEAQSSDMNVKVRIS